VTDEGNDPDRQLNALRHQTRRKIMVALVASKQPMSPREFSTKVEMPLSNASYHFRVLAQMEAITLVDTKPVRGSVQHFYLPSPEFMELSWVSDFLNVADNLA
jgi:DNA-binding transcriptional ArsR family regulator